MEDVVWAEEAALLAHRLEEDWQHAIEADGGVAIVLDHVAEGVVGQQLDGIGEEAEDEAHEEVGDVLLGGTVGSDGALELDALGEAEEANPTSEEPALVTRFSKV